MTTSALPIPDEAIAQFCQRWNIRELALFGSVLGNNFRPDSDVDVLVTFSEDADWGLIAHLEMERELGELLQRPVDLVSKRGLEQSTNWLRRRNILDTALVVVSRG